MSVELEKGGANAVKVIDVDISLWSMVMLFVKAAIAVIPAGLIIAVLYAMLAGFISGLSR